MKNLLTSSKLFFKRNSSTILTCVGAVGVVATAVAAVKATPKALALIKENEEEKGEKLTKKEIIKVAGPAYIPSAIIGAGTIACIFGANVLNKHSQASLASAYALLDGSYKEYKNKVKEVLGEEAEQKVVRSITEDHYADDTSNTDEPVFFDLYSLKFFNTTYENVLKAEQFVNDVFQSRGYVSLGEFYDVLGISDDINAYEIGWSSLAGQRYGYDRIIFEHEKITMANGHECWVISMPVEPLPDYLL